MAKGKKKGGAKGSVDEIQKRLRSRIARLKKAISEKPDGGTGPVGLRENRKKLKRAQRKLSRMRKQSARIAASAASGGEASGEEKSE